MGKFRSRQEMVDLYEAYRSKPEGPRCDRPPKGWKCNAHLGHLGACAAWPDSLWLRLKYFFKFKSLSYLLGRHV